MGLRKIKRFYRPNIINMSLTVLCLGLTWKFLIPLFSKLRIVPCKIFEAESAHFGFCPINPTIIISDFGTNYLGVALGDHIYVVFYFILFVLIIPYTLACIIFHVYYRYIKKIVK